MVGGGARLGDGSNALGLVEGFTVGEDDQCHDVDAEAYDEDDPADDHEGGAGHDGTGDEAGDGEDVGR